jgi:hypothetical protein
MEPKEANWEILRDCTLKGVFMHIPIILIQVSSKFGADFDKTIGSFWAGLVLIIVVKYFQTRMIKNEKNDKGALVNVMLITFAMALIFLNPVLQKTLMNFFLTYIFSLAGGFYYLGNTTVHNYDKKSLMMTTVGITLVGTNVISLAFFGINPLFNQNIFLANIFITILSLMLSGKISSIFERTAVKKRVIDLEDIITDIFARYTDGILILIFVYYAIAFAILQSLPRN